MAFALTPARALILSRLSRVERDVIESYGPHAAARFLDAMGASQSVHPAGAVIGPRAPMASATKQATLTADGTAVPRNSLVGPPMARAASNSAPFMPQMPAVAANLRLFYNEGYGVPPGARHATYIPLGAFAVAPAGAVVGPSLGTGTADFVRAPRMPQSPRTIDAVLATCPTDRELREIRTDFNISFDARIFDDPRERSWQCRPIDPSIDPSIGRPYDDRSVQLFLVNALRAMRLMEFDSPVPLLNETNVYRWLRSANVSIRVFFDDPRGASPYSDFEERVIYLPHTTLQGNAHLWADPSNGGAGVWGVPAILIHEGWHIASGLAHDCDQQGNVCFDDLNRRPSCRSDGLPGRAVNDSTMERGGAWAAHYWYFRWIAERSGDYLTPDERAVASQCAEDVLRYHFCQAPSLKQLAR